MEEKDASQGFVHGIQFMFNAIRGNKIDFIQEEGKFTYEFEIKGTQLFFIDENGKTPPWNRQ